MDIDSTISSGRSTPAMMNGQGSTTASSKHIAYKELVNFPLKYCYYPICLLGLHDKNFRFQFVPR